MTHRAREIGMLSTRYINAHGLDGWAITSLTTAHDLGILARRLLRYPETTRWCSRETHTIRGGQAIRTTNRLLGKFEGMDGIKTGFTGPAGFCFVGTAERDGLRLISVVLGASSNEARFRESAWALTEVFRTYERVIPARAEEPLDLRLTIRGANPETIPVMASADVPLVVRRNLDRPIRMRLRPSTIRLPLEKGAPVGTLDVLAGDSLLAHVPALAAEPTRALTWWERLRARFRRSR